MVETHTHRDQDIVWEMIQSFMQWVEGANLQSYEWFDIWGTSFGGWAKTLYVRNKFLGSFAVAPIVFLDLIYPGFRKSFVQKRAFPICHAQMGMGYLNVWKVTRDDRWLAKAEGLVEPLMEMASPHAHGLGWGMKHEWMTVQGLIPSDTPCNTQTAYPYEFFVRLFEETRQNRYEEYLKGIAVHVANDFPEWRVGQALVSSYSTIDRRRVVNANSYRMFMLIDAGKRFGNRMCTEKGMATLRYILSRQNEDGSWHYSEDQEFVDTYHTCFVLKNLMKVRNLLTENTSELDVAIQKGLSYYFKRLFDKHGYPIPYSIKPRFVLHRYDSYDLAESIGLLADIEGQDDRLAGLIQFAYEEFQVQEGWFIFRKYPLPWIKGIPYMRYANSAMFLALTKVLVKMKNRNLDSGDKN
jgi:hypothetical protein